MALSLAELETESGSVLPARNTMFVLIAGGHNHSFVDASSTAVAVNKGFISVCNTATAEAGSSVTVIQG